MKITKKSPGHIELNGLYGMFYTENAQINVHYFSTFASPDPSLPDGHYPLLEQLKPMREKVDARSISDLDALLQRDLSDERIATSLIPYLKGLGVRVGFFPPVLVVLLPKDYLQGGTSKLEYPDFEIDDLRAACGNHWWLDFYADDAGDRSRLGRLSINKAKTDVIVIDGQHRTNAFRYVANVFEPTGEYHAFYENVSPNPGYLSDLPVTIVWFAPRESHKVVPTDISRELFVAVNNSARQVSEARTTLLDELNVVPLSINTFYRWIAQERGFNSDFRGLNLLSSGFDVDSELTATKQPSMVLTNPSLLKMALEYAFFGSSTYDRLDTEDVRMFEQTNIERFRNLFGGEALLDSEDTAPYVITDGVRRGSFRDKFRSRYLSLLSISLERASMLKVHFDAIRDVEEWAKTQDDPEYETTWSKIFCGGEGLYSAYMNSNRESTKHRSRYITKINQEFLKKRRNRFREGLQTEGASINRTSDAEIDQCYQSLVSKAYQTGFLMAADHIARLFYAYDLEKTSKDLGDSIDKISLSQWLTFFNGFRQYYIEGTNPRQWFRYKKMLLRLLESGRYAIYEGSSANLPEVSIMKSTTRRFIQDLMDRNDGKKPTKNQVERHIGKLAREVSRIDELLQVKLPEESNHDSSNTGINFLTMVAKEESQKFGI